MLETLKYKHKTEYRLSSEYLLWLLETFLKNYNDLKSSTISNIMFKCKDTVCVCVCVCVFCNFLYVCLCEYVPQLRTAVFLLLRATAEAYGSSQARGCRGWIGTSAAGLHCSHRNTGSKPCLQPIPQLMAMLDPTHWVRPGTKSISTGILVGFITVEPQW